MYRFYINRAKDENRFNEVIRLFLLDHEFETLLIDQKNASAYVLTDNSYLINSDGSTDQEKIKRELYDMLVGMTGIRPPWGTLTGVRPLKPLFSEYISAGRDIDTASDRISGKYNLSQDKLELLKEILSYQTSHITSPDPGNASIYVGIPFCPSRCAYCSFSAYVAPAEDISKYLMLLIDEISYASESFHPFIESVYIGGGTPTILDADQLKLLIGTICDKYDVDPAHTEITVEAGRPDSIDRDKLMALRESGIRRISINPQSMDKRVLDAIGRSHGPDDIRIAFEMAHDIGFDSINSDVIAGLPGDDPDGFIRTIQEMTDLGAGNITVHTLSVKRGSRLNEYDPAYYRHYESDVASMLDDAGQMLRDRGFRPYYIYRQKHQIGSLENVGWCLEDMHSIYNIRIMEDKQTVIGLGAGAVGKVYDNETGRVHRIPNVSDYRIYTDRFQDVLDRKKGYIK